MGLFDWIGPTSLTKRRGRDALPAAAPEHKATSYTIGDQRAVLTVNTLVHGPGASDLAGAWRNGDSNSAVWACLQALCTAYLEAPLYAYLQVSPKDREPLFDSPLQAFLDDPNPHLDLSEIFWWWTWAKHVDGNAYMRKVRAGDELTGNVVELWPISPARVEVKTTPGSGDFISYYRYHKAPGKWDDIPPENMIHGRLGLDDRDHRLGCSNLKHLVREISSDDEATRFADALLRNYAIPGLLVNLPAAVKLTQADADELKAKVASKFGGDQRGQVGIIDQGGSMVPVGFSPEQMDLKILHRVPEERITAVLRTPAIVAGLGAGLDRATYSNYGEAKEQFTEGTILPLYRADDRKLTKGLARDFSTDRRVVIAHDTSQMRALQDDEDKKATRLKTYVDAGILDVDEARAEIGREPKAQPALPAPSQEQRSRPRIVTLPLARKSLDDLPGEYEALRDDRQPDWEAELRTFLAAQLRRVNAALRAGGDTAEALVAEGEATLLGEVLSPLQAALLSDVHGLVAAELGIAFDLDDPATRAYLRAAGSNIVGITDTTREAIRAALVEGQAAGEGVEQLARRLRSLAAFNDKRARTVARTELAHASNEAALASYRASGVVSSVTVFDGDYDAECAAMNGRVFPLSQPPATLQHPNCRRAFAPVVASQEASA